MSDIESGFLGQIWDGRFALRQAREQTSAEGAHRELCPAIFWIVAMPVRRVDQLQVKRAALCRHIALTEPAWLTDAMIGSIMLLEDRSMRLLPAEGGAL